MRQGSKERVDALIVGAGFSGLTAAQQLAEQLGWRCAVVDKRHHIGGNCRDEYDENGVLVHLYGPHYFRTNSPRVLDYLSRFTQWRDANYCVTARTGEKGNFVDYQFPLNLITFEQYIGRVATCEEFEAWLEHVRVKFDREITNSEDWVMSQVGREWFELFFRGYTKKQWKCEARELDKQVCARIPLRLNRDCRYLVESFQKMPVDGYSALFEKMLNSSPLLSFDGGVSFDLAKEKYEWKHLIWTGPIDEFFDYEFGILPYRSLRFEWEHKESGYFNPCVQVNFTHESIPWTREVEIKYVTGQEIAGSSICREFPLDWQLGREAFYPVPNEESQALYQKYKQKADAISNVTFIGRLATYRYSNMDQVVEMALDAVEEIISSSRGAVRK